MEPPSWPARFSRLRQLFWLFSLLTIAYMIWVRNYLAPLSSDEIVQFEIAKTADKAQTIVDNWKITGKYIKGVKSTYFAWLFMALYTLAIPFWAIADSMHPALIPPAGRRMGTSRIRPILTRAWHTSAFRLTCRTKPFASRPAENCSGSFI